MTQSIPERTPGDPLLRAMGPMVMTRSTKVTRGAGVLILAAVILTGIDVLLRPAMTVTGHSIPPLSEPDAQQMVAWTFLAVPVAMYLYFWLSGSLRSLIPELRETGVIIGPKRVDGPPIEAFEHQAELRYERDWWVALALFVIWAYSLVKFLQVRPVDPPSTIQLVLDLVFSAIVIYAATLSFCRLIAAILVTTDLFEAYAVRVFPHHPDGAGGFGPIGRRLTVLARAGAVAGFAAIFINVVSFQQGNNLLTSMETILGVGVLLVLAPLVLWFWLRGPHEAMLEARGAMVKDVCAVYDRIARAPLVSRRTVPGITSTVKEGTELLLELDRRAVEIAQAYPAWPIHTTGLRAAWAAVAAPLVAGVVGIAIGFVRNLMSAG